MADKRIEEIAKVLQVLFPKTHTFLEYTKDYELLFAVILSAQATDISVNKATSVLFQKFPNLDSYDETHKKDIFDIIKPLGLANSKSEYLIKTATALKMKYHGEIPRDRNELMKLDGVGYKTSGVVLAELYDYPYFPVDTHVKRVSIRLGLVDENSSIQAIEEKLEKLFEGYHLIHLHRQFILFGRNICFSRNPDCKVCPFSNFCAYFKNESMERRRVNIKQSRRSTARLKQVRWKE